MNDATHSDINDDKVKLHPLHPSRKIICASNSGEYMYVFFSSSGVIYIAVVAICKYSMN